MVPNPKIYGVYGSPPFGSVLACAKALGIELDIEEADLFSDVFLKEYIKICPQRTVPLLDDNGFILADSHAINGYLVGTYGKENDPLYPKDDIKRRALIDHRLHLDSGILTAKAFGITRPLVIHSIKPTQVAFDGLKYAFEILDKQIEIQNTKYIAGDILSIADFSVTTTVTFWSGYFLKNWEKEYPNIKSYIDRMAQEDWYDVNARGITAFNDLMDMRLNQNQAKK